MYRFTSTSNKPSLVSSDLYTTSNYSQPSSLFAPTIDSVSNTSEQFRTQHTARTSIFKRSALLDKLNRENQENPLLVNYNPVVHNPFWYEAPSLPQQPDVMTHSFMQASGMPHRAEPNLGNLLRYLSKLPAEIATKIEDGVQRFHSAAVHFHRISQILTNPRLTNEAKDQQMFDLCGITANLTHTTTLDAHLCSLHKLEECLTKCFAMNFHSMSSESLLMMYGFNGRTSLNFIHQRLCNGI